MVSLKLYGIHKMQSKVESPNTEAARCINSKFKTLGYLQKCSLFKVLSLKTISNNLGMRRTTQPHANAAVTAWLA